MFWSNNNKPLFTSGNNLFANTKTNNNSLFSENLFGNNNNNSTNKQSENNNSTPLFSNNIISNPFSQIKGESFLKNIIDNKDNKPNNNENKEVLFGENNDEGEDDERDKPKTKYNAEPLKSQDYTDYDKLYSVHLNNLFLYNKEEKKFISKGSGFFSIEKTKEEKSKIHQAVVVFRNQTGNKLVEGFVDKKFDKFDIYNKEFNYVVSFGIIMMVDGKPELGYIKIPFKNEENSNQLKEAFAEAISFLGEK